MRLALRSLCKSPGFSLVALLTLTLGIGLNTSMFSLVNALLFANAPYPEPDRLVRVFRTSPQSRTWTHSLPDLTDVQEQNRSFASLTAFQWWAFAFAEPGQPAVRLNGVYASANVFATLGVQPVLGRGFSAEEQQPGRDRVAVLSHQFWRRQFGADPTVVGRSIRLDAEPVTIIGVLPASAEYPLFWGNVDLWRPLPLTNDWRQVRATHWLNAMGRLKPGVAPAQAQAELSAIAARLAQQYPAENAGTGLEAVPLPRSATGVTERNLSWFAFGLSGFVLLIACANLANLQLARTAARAREFAVRAALGASRRRLIAPLLTESLLLSLAGGALGLMLALWLNDALGRVLSLGAAGIALSLEPTVLAVALLATLGTGVLFGIGPGLLAARTDVNAALKQQSRGSTGDRTHQRFRHGLIAAEVALALALLSGAGFFIRGLQRFMDRHPGWETSGLLTGTVTLPANRYATPEERRAFHRELERRLPAMPGVERAALGTGLPIAADRGANSIVSLFVEGQPVPPPGQAPVAGYTVVNPAYFAALEVPLVAGRLFTEDLRPDSRRQIVINETMARQLWPNADPIGQRISTSADRPEWEEVIGVVRDLGYAAYAGPPDARMQFYRPLVQESWGYVTIILRSPAPETLAEPLRRLVATIDPDLAVTELRTVRQAVDERQNNYYVINKVLGSFALLGLVLSAIGLYGVIAGFVVQRLPEFGIRQALGATPQNVLGQVLGRGLRLALLGVAIGVAASFALVEALTALLPGLPGQDLGTLVFNIALLLAVAALAAWLPARRATQVDPMIALRAE